MGREHSALSLTHGQRRLDGGGRDYLNRALQTQRLGPAINDVVPACETCRHLDDEIEQLLRFAQDRAPDFRADIQRAVDRSIAVRRARRLACLNCRRAWPAGSERSALVTIICRCVSNDTDADVYDLLTFGHHRSALGIYR